jgi:hypothetical protein
LLNKSDLIAGMEPEFSANFDRNGHLAFGRD